MKIQVYQVLTTSLGGNPNIDKKNFSITAYAVDSLDQSFLINMRKYVNYIYITNDNLHYF